MSTAPLTPTAHRTPSPLAAAAAWWGIGGIALLLAQGVRRLAPVALEAFHQGPWTARNVALLVGWTCFACYVEGYRAFHRRFAPRAVARAMHLRAHPEPLRMALAPLFCMALFHAPRRRVVASWCVTFGVITVVAVVRRFAQPYRGIVDAGVLLALLWGVVALLGGFVRALRGRMPSIDPEVPAGTGR